MNDSIAVGLSNQVIAPCWKTSSRNLPASLPWRDVLLYADLERVAYLVQCAADPTGSSVPNDTAEALKATHCQSAAIDAVRLADLALVRDMVDELGAPIMALKGAALSESM